ncbi:DUF4232 domain-containing protein [Streptomyces sp. Rer75]|uniref:DUF4232 domain-containing protein n=1 Tax=Streptomyces sp. Rer75 TaxID=2750011 RepID=UPI0015CFA54C|nr:DUF4232 domain-containing protein [Streptomyces sp. Rer75]QLH23011.1 DUF4232 domain-containing protein [Streptomyces sp. Rer75]
MSHSTAFLARHARTIRSVAAGLTVVAAGLTLTACGDNDGTGAKSSGQAQSSATAQADQGGADAGARGDGGSDNGTGGGNGTGGAKGGAQGSGTGGAQDTEEKAGENGSAAGKNSGGSGSEAAQEIGACDVNKAAVSVESVKRPVNHLLLKFTNRAGVDCNVPYYPVLRFGAGQSATPAIEDSKPQAVVTLAPGETAYAGITTSGADGSGSGGTKESTLEVFLKGYDYSTTVNLPNGGVYVDSASKVTYWQSSASDALTW